MPQNINRLLTRPLTRLLLKTPLSANQVTLLSLIVGLTAGPFFAPQQYALNLAGALLFQLYYLLDNCDGEIARLKNQQSVFGGWFDVSTDTVVHTSLYFWLAIWIKKYHPELTAVALLALAGILFSYGLSLLAHSRGFTLDLNPVGCKSLAVPLSLRHWLRLNLNNENFSLLFLAVILFNAKILFLFATAVGANFFWVKFLVNKREALFPA